MNLANKLTLFRIALVPFFIAFTLLDIIPRNYLWALAVFAVASLTDFFDGYIARKYGMVTPLGKFLDPIADKVLVSSALICFVQNGWAAAWAVSVIIAREFIVSGIRLAAVEGDEKKVIAARFSGKLKTAATMLAVCGILLMWALADFGVITLDNIQLISDILIYVCTTLTVISGAQYAWDYRHIFTAK